MQTQVKLWNKNFVCVILINFLVFLNHLAILSTFPFYIETPGGSEAVAGIATALFCVVSVICRPIIGWMLDNGKRKAILVIGLCGMMIMPLGYLLFGTLLLAFICRMAHGAAVPIPPSSARMISASALAAGLPAG